MIKKIIQLLLISTLSVTSVTAQEEITQSDVKEINEYADPNVISKLSSSDSIDDWSENVLNQFGLSSFGEHEGKFFIYAQQAVMLEPSDPQFGDAVVNAYDKAMMKLHEKYVLIRFGKTTVDKIKSFYNDRSTNGKKLELPASSSPGFLSKIMTLLNKQLDVIGAKLDDELIELGVDKERIDKMTPTMKKDLFRDKFVKNTIRKAQGSIAGLVPIQTSIASDHKGRYSIGVIAVASPKTIQIAKDISLQRKSIVVGKGRVIDSLLPASNDLYLGTFGTRLAYDLSGSPVVISYGIASYLPDSDDDYINDELESDARDTAIANADAQIAELINGQMSVKSQKQSGEEIRKYVERETRSDSDTIEKSIKNIIKITNKIAKSSASARLQGISTIKTWRYTSPQKHKFVGVVRVWKYSTLKAVKGFNRFKKESTDRRNYSGRQAVTIQSSEPVNTMNDF